MKTLAVISAVGFMLGMSQRQLAQAVGVDPMPWTAQLGVCGACLSIVLIVVVRVIPQVTKENGNAVRDAAATNGKSIDGLKQEICGLRDDVREGNEKNTELLRQALFNGKGPA